MAKNWFAIHTKPRQEVRAEENLRNQDYRVYLPRLEVARRRRGKWVDVVEPMFPRYLFIELALHEDNVAPIRSTLGVANMVSFSDKPAVVPQTFVESLIASENADKHCHVPESELFMPGSGVEIIDGPLAGLRAVVQCDKGEERVILLLNMLGRENATAVSRHHLVPDSM